MTTEITSESHGETRNSDLEVAAVIRDRMLHARLARALDAAGVTLGERVASSAELSMGASVILVYENRDRAELLRAVHESRALFPHAALITVWPLTNAADARRILREGADGVISEAELSTTIVPTINAVRSGLICIPRPMRAQLESDSLSAREKQVLGMVVMGFTNGEIAAKLYLAESTIKSHLSSAYTKLGVRSRKDATSMILDPTEGFGPGILAISG
jgi:DNA-binding NarL/FixJ family response regulator